MPSKRGRTSPGQNLEQAAGMLAQVEQSLGSGPYSREQLAEALGHSSLSGPAQVKVGALAHYDLLDREGSEYSLSALGRQVLFPTTEQEKAAALSQACQAPNLYGELFARFADQRLPELLPNILTRDFGVVANTSKAVADRFRASAMYAGLLIGGRLRTEPLDETEDAQHKDPGNSCAILPGETQQSVPPQVVAPVISPVAKNENLRDFSIPLSNKQTGILQLPSKVSESDLDRIISWIELMRDVLTESPADEGASD